MSQDINVTGSGNVTHAAGGDIRTHGFSALRENGEMRVTTQSLNDPVYINGSRSVGVLEPWLLLRRVLKALEEGPLRWEVEDWLAKNRP